MSQGRDNSNNRDIRHINGRTYDFTETHNNIRGGHNNKRPKLISTDHNQRTTPNYEPSKLFNVLAGGALLAVLTIGGYNTLANIIKTGIDTKNSIEDVKDAVSEVKETLSTQNKSKGSYKVKDFLKYDIDEGMVQECIERVYVEFSESEIDTVIEDVIILDYADADTVEKYKKNVLKKIANKENTVTVILMSKDILNEDSAQERFNNYNDIVENSIEYDSTEFKGVTINGVTNIPYNSNMAIVITYYCTE